MGTIEISFLPGTDISKCLAAMIALSNQIMFGVRTKLNGTEVVIYPGAMPYNVAQKFYTEYYSKGDFKSTVVVGNTAVPGFEREDAYAEQIGKLGETIRNRVAQDVVRKA